MTFALVITLTCLSPFCGSMRQDHWVQLARVLFTTEDACWAAEDAFDDANAKAVESDVWDLSVTCEVE